MILFEPLQPSMRLPAGGGQALAPGAMVEEFEIREVLGLTSFGALYLAAHTGDGHTVALKEYLPAAIAMRGADGQVELRDTAHETSFKRGLQSFLGEALALTQFNHPHLVQVACVWEGHGTAYRAMPLYPGRNLLAARFAMEAAPDEARLRSWLDGLLDAVDMLHCAGIVHGQIEPLNILLLDDGRALLLDFDAVRRAILDDAAGRAPDPRSDLQALAAVMRFMITGRWMPAGDPAGKEPLAELVARLKAGPPQPEYSLPFLQALDAASGLSPSHRVDTAAQLRALLHPSAPAPQATAAAVQPHAEPPAAAAPLAPARTNADTASVPAKPPASQKRALPTHRQSDYPLNSSESVLALLAEFERQPMSEGIEPFQAPPVPTLTEEAEPALPPLRENPFDALEAGRLPPATLGYGRMNAPMAPLASPPLAKPVWRWRRAALWGVATLMLVAVGALGWQFKG